MRDACLVLVLLAACGPGGRALDASGGDDVADASPADADHTSDPIGMVNGVTLTGPVRYLGQTTTGNDVIVLKDGGVACQSGGETHAIAIAFPCGPVAVGTYPLSINPGCGSPGATLNVTGFAFPLTVLFAQAGSVVITATTPTVQGSFNGAQFYNPVDLVAAPGVVSGSFDVPICP